MYFEDLTVGSEMTLDKAIIDKNKMLAFAREYDNVPLHTDEEYAKNTRFGGLIAPGMMSFLEVWAKYLEKDFLGEQLVAGRSTKVEWFLPVFAGDELTGKGKITSLAERNNYNGLVEFRLDVYNQENELVLAAETSAVVQRKPKQAK